MQAAAMQQGPMQTGMMQQGPMQPGMPQQEPMMQGRIQAGPGPEPVADGGAGYSPCGGCNAGLPQWEAFGEFIYIRPGNANVAYGGAVSDQTPGAVPAVQVAPPGIASIDYHPGFRAGFSKSLDECNAVVVSETHYEGENGSSISGGVFPVQSLITNPSTAFLADSAFAGATSDYAMRFDLADVAVRWTFENENDTRLSLLAGVRYAALNQRLDSTFTGSANGDTQNVHSQVDFEGGGFRIGFDGERKTPHGLLFYGRTSASLLDGSFRGAYTHSSVLVGPLVDTGYSANRVVPIIEAELGVGVSLWNDKLRLTAGYSFSGWFNIVRTDQFIGAVQNNNFSGMSDGMTFDGLVGRAELQF
jgi:hypothetical protein